MSRSSEALSEDPTPLKGRVRWNRRAFMVRIMASAKDKRRGSVWCRKDENSERDAGKLWRRYLWKSTRCVVVEVTFFRGDFLSNSCENNGFRHVIPGSKLRVEHVATQTQMIRCFCQDAHRMRQSVEYFPVVRL